MILQLVNIRFRSCRWIGSIGLWYWIRCSDYSTSANCPTSDCKWVNDCEGKKANFLDAVDNAGRCVSDSQTISSSCINSKCGAECDSNDGPSCDINTCDIIIDVKVPKKGLCSTTSDCEQSPKELFCNTWNPVEKVSTANSEGQGHCCEQKEFWLGEPLNKCQQFADCPNPCDLEDPDTSLCINLLKQACCPSSFQGDTIYSLEYITDMDGNRILPSS